MYGGGYNPSGMPTGMYGAGPGAAGAGGGGSSSQESQSIPESLSLMPLYAMALQKNVGLRGGHDVRIDERAYYHQLMLNMDVDDSKVFIYPRLFSIHDMALEAGTPNDNADDAAAPCAGPQNIRLPAILNLSHERLDTEGVFLLENGHDMFLWIGRGVSPTLLTSLFGVGSLDGIDMAALVILSDSCQFANRLQMVINALRAERTRFMQLHFIREGDGYADAFFARYLVEDRYVNFTKNTL